MEVLSGPWADLALLLRQTMVQTDRETDSFFPLWLFGLLLFLCVCLMLLQLIVYLSWKIRQVEECVVVENRSAIYRQMNRSADRSRRSVG